VEFKVEVTGAALDDVIATEYDRFDESVDETTIGDVIVAALADRITADPRWDALAGKIISRYLEDELPVFVSEMVTAEVQAQLGSKAQGAMTRGEASTRAQAMIATEVTTQLREKFAPLVDEALRMLNSDLGALRVEALEAFRKGAGQ
jgi:hypothetical protein